MKRLACLLAPTLLALAAAAAAAQSDDEGLEEIVVTGRRELGAVLGDITPELQLSAEEIRALGVSSVAELLTALGPQLGSNRGRGSGRPIVLVNGVRTSGFGEVRDLPTEAILRTDILPEEVALKYGYRADQRVVNIVLRPRFRAYTGEFGARGSTDGGREGADLNGGWLRIQRDDRLQVDLKARRDEGLLESERNVVGASGVPNADASFRSLSPTSEQLTANLVLAKPFGEGFAMTVNASLDDGQRDSLLGLRSLPTGLSTLRRSVETQDARLGAILQGTLPGWRWSATAGLERGDSRTSTSGEGLTGRSRTDTADLDFVINGSVFDLPAGAASLTAKLALGTRGIDSASRRGAQDVRSDLSRDQREAQLNLDLPLLRSEAGAGGFGNLTLNLNAAVEDISDVGSLDTTGYGLIWSRGRQFRVIATVTDEQGAPSMQQLGGAVITTPFVRTFDLLRGETVDITRIDGGNAALSPDRRKVFKLGLGSRPFEDVDFDLNADWTRSETRDLVSSLPIASPELEAVFRDRFQRDPSGRLLAIDARPVNLAGRERDDLRVSFNLSRPWGPQPESPMPRQRGAGGGDPRVPAGGTVVVAPSGGAPVDDAARRARMAQMGERFLAFARRGSVQLSLAYTQRLNDELTIAPGLAALDLLAGDTLFDTAGVSRHELELALGANREGYGARMTTQWRAGSRIARVAAGNTRNDLEFSDLTTVNLRLFADLGLVEWARPYPMLRGARVSLVVGNLFNERQDVRALDGSTPVNYQADLLDPLGRNVRLTFRKLFFPGMPPPGGRTG
jgi:hypothetical protein